MLDKTYEVRYYKKGEKLHSPKRQIVEASTRQEAFDTFRSDFPSTVVLGVKRVKVTECVSDYKCQ